MEETDQLQIEIAKQKPKLMPVVGEVVKLVCANQYYNSVNLHTESGLTSISVPNETEVIVLEIWNDYIRVKHQRYTKRWVHKMHVQRKTI